MTIEGWILILGFTLIVAALARPVGLYLDAVYAGRRTWLTPLVAPVERGIYALAGVRPQEAQGWRTYAVGVVVFSLVSALVVHAILRLQGVLPFNPQGFEGVPPAIAANTAVSFVTNTNWQSYGGETTMSHLSQMAALTVQNFASAAVGMAVAVAVSRGIAARGSGTLGNFWVDLMRGVLYVLLPACVVLALPYVALGIPQTLAGSLQASTLEGPTQDIAVGPVASQVAIKMLGTNGGGFFNANAAHPLENTGALTNFIQMVSIFVLGAGLCVTFGRIVGDERQGWAILAAMGSLFLVGVGLTYWAESHASAALVAAGVDPSAGNMEGKETRFGIAASALFAVVTTAASCGAVNAMHDSFTPLGGMVPMVNMMLGEVIVGGVGAGLYGMLVFVLLTVFIAGLMVGRTPTWLGKRIEAREVRLAVFAILAAPFAILVGTAFAAAGAGTAGVQDGGPHGFSEMLYAFTSAGANNGSAFGGLTATSDFWAYGLAAAMMVGRFLIIVPVLAIAGALSTRSPAAASAGAFPTSGPLFVGLLVAIVLIVGGLTFFPALALGPLAEATASGLF